MYVCVYVWVYVCIYAEELAGFFTGISVYRAHSIRGMCGNRLQSCKEVG